MSECEESISVIEDWDSSLTETEDYEIFNDELFLKLISQYPAIFNTQNKGFSNRILKENAFEYIAESLHTTVDFCKKRWKSLREKYHREKQKNELATRSGAPASQTPHWPLMSYMHFMFDNRNPRNSVSSPIQDSQQLDRHAEISTSGLSIAGENSTKARPSSPGHIEPSIQPSSSQPHHNLTIRPKKRKLGGDEQVVNIFKKLSNSVEEMSEPSTQRDKVVDFANYFVSEVKELSVDVREEFLDETLIRLLQIKRKCRQK